MMDIKGKLDILKEIFVKANKKNIVIIVVSLLAIIAFIACGYYMYKDYQYKKYVLQERSVEEDNSESIMYKKAENVANKKPSEYKIGIPYEKALKGDKPIIVLFYADWCGYCRRFMPNYESISKIYKKSFNFSKLNVEDPKYEADVTEYRITGFPTVYIIDPRYDNRVLLPNAILGDLKKLRTEIDRYSRIRSLLDAKK